MAHTPGPWVAWRATMRAMIAEISATRGEKIWTIAHVDEVDGGDIDAANARLIAAAPDLLAALETVAPILESHFAKSAKGVDGTFLDEVRAAIAKARGK